MSKVKTISNFEHHFLIAAGGAQCLLEACWNTVAVGPAKAIYAKFKRKPAPTKTGFIADLLGPDPE